MPSFTIEGNPAGIRSRAATTRGKAEQLVATGDGLAKVTTDGWTSRAADRFREKFDTEPERWREAGDGFVTAAGALEAYADALEDAQRRARWAEDEYARGDRVSHEARSSYDADVARAKHEVSTAAAAGQHLTLTIVPFHDPGDAIRQGALDEYAAARRDLAAAAHRCADGVRAGCRNAPEKRKWYEKVGAAIGGFLQGAGEALLDLGKLAAFLTNPAMWAFNDLMADAASGLTAEEIAAKWQLKVDDAEGLLQALKDDPLELGKNIGKAMLDWDTWSDDPARALGHLVPDAIIAVLTAGSGTVATRGAKGGLDAVEGLAEMGAKADDLTGLRHLDDLGDLEDLRHLDDLGPAGMWEHSGPGQRELYDQLMDPSYSPDNAAIIERDYDPLGGFESPEAFADRFVRETGDPDYPVDWDWPPNDGAVPGTTEMVVPEDGLRIDRIGGPNGSYFSPEGTPMGERALPPDRLNFPRTHWEVDADNPALRSGEVRVEQSRIEPWFGQDGGGVQLRFLDADGMPLPQAEVDRLEIIKPVR